MNNIFKTLTSVALFSLTASLHAEAVTIENPSFESRWAGWNDTDPSAISGEAYDGGRSAKLEGDDARMEQLVLIEEDTNYTLTAWIKGKGKVGVTINGMTKLAVDIPLDALAVVDENSEQALWRQVTVSFNSGSSEDVLIFGAYTEGTGRFDLFSMTSH